MPTYEYACKSCGEHLEVVQSFKDDSLTVCPNCDGELRKVFGSIGIAFKGSGFYKTDSRGKATSGSPPKNGDGAETKDSSKISDTKTSEGGEKKSGESVKSSDSKSSDSKSSDSKSSDSKSSDTKSSDTKSSAAAGGT